MSHTLSEDMRGPEPQKRSQQHYLSDFSLSSHTLGTFFSHTSEGFLPPLLPGSIASSPACSPLRV